MATVNIIQAIESGTILNEHYTFQEYVNRRGGWLGKHPNFARMPTGLFAIAHRNAAEVFGGDPALSVQEVRRRELACDVDPLLPLPTTDNTKTLDSFRSYPDREWSPNLVFYPPQVTTDEDDAEYEALWMPTTNATGRDAHAGSVSQMVGGAQIQSQRQRTQPSARSSTPSSEAIPPPTAGTQDSQSTFKSRMPGTGSFNGPSSASQTSKQRPLQSANMPQNMLSRQQTHAKSSAPSTHPRMSDQSSSQFAISSSPMAEKTSTRATTPEGSNAIRPPTSNGSQRELVRSIIDALGTPAPDTAHPSSQLANVDAGIGSLANRGIHVPVKQKRGTKRAASESPAATDSVIDSQILDGTPPPGQRPAKKLKLKGPRDQTSPPSEGAFRRSGSPHTAPKATNKKKRSAPKKQKISAPQESDDDIEAVVAGTALPKSKDEAKRASTLRHDRLMADHRAAQPTKAGSRKRPTNTVRKDTIPDPDLMPEFFNPANFPPGEEMDTVRCICGVTYDDNGNMLSCDECNVWQHNACMGDAVPKDVRRGKYLCQMCDPWAHRALLSEVRQEQNAE